MCSLSHATLWASLENLTRRNWLGTREKAYAVCRAVELIGEAANRVPQADQAAMPFIAWSQIIAMRNRIIHGYHAVDAGMLVSTVRDHLPTLCERFERAIGDRPDEC
ncbi:MAG: DUF86 domain-containing protein [Alphaproteobacteria bacterium]|nr:DUF86 domain-containing protein [Alphaproteobacteria bacterium]